MAKRDWENATPQERAAAFRAHHRDGMPYPSEVNIDAEIDKFQKEGQ